MLIITDEKSMGEYCRELCEDGHLFPDWFLHLRFLYERSAQDLPCKQMKFYTTWGRGTGGFCVWNIREFDSMFWPSLKSL
jgi:hypothetical protein